MYNFVYNGIRDSSQRTGRQQQDLLRKEKVSGKDREVNNDWTKEMIQNLCHIEKVSGTRKTEESNCLNNFIRD